MRIRGLALLVVALGAVTLGVSCSVPTSPTATTSTTTTVTSNWRLPSPTTEGEVALSSTAVGVAQALPLPSGGVAVLAMLPGGGGELSTVSNDGVRSGPWPIPDVQQAVSFAIDGSGRYVVAAIDRATPRRPVVLRLLPNGSVDSSFGTGGRVTFPAGPDGTHSTGGVAIDGSGRILLTTRPFENFSPSLRFYLKLWRLLPDGALDPAFGGGGGLDVGTGETRGAGPPNPDFIHVRQDGRVLLVSGLPSEKLVQQFRPDGSGLDTTFGSGGATNLAPAGLPSVGYSARIDGAAVVPGDPSSSLRAGDLSVALETQVYDPLGNAGPREFILRVRADGTTYPGDLSQPALPTSGLIPTPRGYFVAGVMGVDLRYDPAATGSFTLERSRSGLQVLNVAGVPLAVTFPAGVVPAETGDGASLANLFDASGVPLPFRGGAALPVRDAAGHFFAVGRRSTVGARPASGGSAPTEYGDLVVVKMKPTALDAL